MNYVRYYFTGLIIVLTFLLWIVFGIYCFNSLVTYLGYSSNQVAEVIEGGIVLALFFGVLPFIIGAAWWEDQMEKRKFVYIQKPHVYCIAGCKCGNEFPEWSENVGMLWCDKCKIDFVPEHHGIFDGPLSIHTCNLMGICFDRVNIETGEVVKFDTPEWDLSVP